MRDKTADDGWRIYPGLLYTLLTKMEKDAFHNGVLDQSQSEGVKKGGFGCGGLQQDLCLAVT